MLRWVQPAWSKLDNSKALAAKYLPALFFSPTTQVPRYLEPGRHRPVASLSLWYPCHRKARSRLNRRPSAWLRRIHVH
ncbi:hypothetical protein TGAMA5MH_10143 [Trichoderma gamsii]|uniref:Uncharacterized protein n=1 Tax=Trichoderma gamsii TaxID=398673 RepID=A0A2K0SXQ5_9HYPO|nr:hypothetical protein TGAMA5MH_10143 [Trichoderma gamsii]